MSEAAKQEWVAVAQLLRPQGRKGELLAEPMTDRPGVLAREASFRLAGPEALAPGVAGGEVTLEDVWQPTGRNAGRVVLKLKGCDDISAAEALAGKQLIIRAEELPALEEGQFYVRDLVGCALLDTGTTVGEIVDVQFPTTPDGKQRLEEAADLLEVRRVGGADTVLVPFVRAWLVRVDVERRRVEMRLPEGLVDVPGDVEAPDEKS